MPVTKSKKPVITKAKTKTAPVSKAHVKSVARIDTDSNNTHGWYVRVTFSGKKVSKFFSDRLWEGKRKALAAAIAFRDETEKKLGKPRTDRVVMAPKSKGKSKIAGIRRKIVSYTNAGGETKDHAVYEVVWNPEPGKSRRTTISIRKYGEKKALLMAKAIRLEKEKEIYGRVIRL